MFPGIRFLPENANHARNQIWWRIASRPLRSRLSNTNHWDEFDEPAGKLVAVKRPKEREPVGTSICLLQQLLEVEVDENYCANQRFGPEIWLALPEVRHYSGQPKIGF
jgi:hypothetical protein